jgi:hypothetical protein
MTLWKWSQTAASNSNSDSTIDWAEGQTPGSINNSARALMAAVAKARDDWSGIINTGGTGTAYTITSNQGLTSLTDGFKIVARTNAASGAAPTLAVDGLAAKAIRTHTSTALPTGALNSGGIYCFTYDSGDDCWYVHDFYTVSVTEFADNAFRVQDNGDATKELAFELSGLTTGNTRTLTVPDADGTILIDDDIGVTIQPIMTGAIVAWPTATPLSGWLECDGAAVSRTTYADLFAVISDDYGPGNGTTTFNLPDLRGEFIRGFDNGAGNDPDAASRTDRGDGTTGDAVGTKQDFALENITGTVGRLQSSDANPPPATGAFSMGSTSNTNGGGGGPTAIASFDASDVVQTSTETRPRNVAMMWIIKT